MNRQKGQGHQTATPSLSNNESELPNTPFLSEPPFPDTTTPDKERKPLLAPSCIRNNSTAELTRVLSDREWSDPAIWRSLDALREETEERRSLQEYFYPTRLSIRGFLRSKCPSLESLYLAWITTGSIPSVVRTLHLCMRANFLRAFERTSYFLTITIPRKLKLIDQEII